MKTLKILGLTTITMFLAVSLNAKGLGAEHSLGLGEKMEKLDVSKPRYQGTIIEVLDAKSYTYLKIDEKTSSDDQKKLKEFWIVVDKSSAKVEDYVRFQKELVTKNFQSEELNRTFDEIMFASKLEYRVSK